MSLIDEQDETGGVVLAIIQGNDLDAQVVGVACRVAQKRGTKVIALFPMENLWVESSLSGKEMEARATNALSDAKRIAEKEGSLLEGRVLSTKNTVLAILDEVDELGAGTVVIARPFPTSRGDAARYVLEKASCGVLVL